MACAIATSWAKLVAVPLEEVLLVMEWRTMDALLVGGKCTLMCRVSRRNEAN
jgi:hypothetical protein